MSNLVRSCLAMSAVLTLTACMTTVPTTGRNADLYYVSLKAHLSQGYALDATSAAWLLDYEAANPHVLMAHKSSINAVAQPETQHKPLASAESYAAPAVNSVSAKAKKASPVSDVAQPLATGRAMRGENATPPPVSEARVAPPRSSGNNGTYAVEGGSYSINVRFLPGALEVVEPNKVSRYTQRSGTGEYYFTNPTNQITYGLRVVDSLTLEAFKPSGSGASTVLRRSSPAAAEQANTLTEQYDALAREYYDNAINDPANTQVWTMCAAAAMGWSQKSQREAENYVRQAAAMIKPIMVDPSNTPCERAIPSRLW